MQVYPAYTINKIEDELTWKDVTEMMSCWDDETTNLKLRQRMDMFFRKVHGLTVEKKNEKLTDQALLNNLFQMGLL